MVNASATSHLRALNLRARAAAQRPFPGRQRLFGSTKETDCPRGIGSKKERLVLSRDNVFRGVSHAKYARLVRTRARRFYRCASVSVVLAASGDVYVLRECRCDNCLGGWLGEI